MKKTISILISLVILMTGMTVFVSAENENTEYTYEIDGYEYTVKFVDSNLTAEKQEAVAAKLIGAEISEAVPANILCDIFGHDYLYTTADVVTHKVKVYSPRCRKQTYDVTTCEDCDYVEQTLVKSSYIVCCPAD